jgi:Zinc carboxypeptidase
MHRLATGLALTLAAALAPPTALASPAVMPAVKRTLTASSGRCDTSAYSVPMAGFVTVRDDGTTRGDWDLAIRDARSKRTLATSNAFGSREVAQTFVTMGQRLSIRGCRVSGGDSTFPVSIVLTDASPPADARPSLVRVPTMNKGVLRRLDSLGFDVTENVRDGHADIVAPTAQKLALLKKLGVPFKLRSLDMRKDFVKAREADARYSARMGAAGSPLPSGRTGYRTLADYQSELKQLVADHPGLVRPVTLGQTFQGRPIQGVEIADNVNAANDGRPVFLLVGEHHAREWPSGEASMEFAHLIVDGFGNDEQITALARKERIVVVPIVNVDGFNASRGTAEDGYIPDPADASGVPEGDTVEGVAMPFGGNLAYRRKNCDGLIPNGPNHEEQNLPCYYQIGVDPNRNYGQNWGGVGASSDPNTQSYRGSGQWSEPETQAVWHWSQAHNVTFMMTLHNVAALVLRPPGVHTDGQAPDEQRMKELGDEMAADTGYTSQYGFQLYDTSGTTEDWQYGGQGAFGYTIEIGPAGGQFHMPYQTGVVDQWTGTGDRTGRGLRSALLRAAESAGNPGDHSVIQGAAPAGSVLRLKKSFATVSSPICTFAQGLLVAGGPLAPLDCVAPGGTTSTPDGLDYTMVVPPSGTYEWHVTPSTRPFVAHKVTPGGYSDTAYKSETFEPTDKDVPAGDRGTDDPQGLVGSDEKTYSAERRFTLDPSEAGNKVVVDLNWDAPAQDFDLRLYHVAGDGSLQPAGSGTGPTGGTAGGSGEANGIPEQIEVDKAEAGDYVARVVYYLTGSQQIAQANDWHMKVSRFAGQPDKVESAKEYWTMSCETADGHVLESKEIYVERGQAMTADFACGGTAPAGGAETTTAGQESRAQVEVPGQRPASGSKPAAKPKPKPVSKRPTCLRKANKIRSKSKRKAAVRRCNKRYRAKAR